MCPGDEVLIGVQATATAGMIYAVAALCGRVDIVPPAPGEPGPATLPVREGVVLPTRGAVEGSVLVGRCPAGEVVTGFDTIFDVTGNTYMMRRLRLFCAPLSIRLDGAIPAVEVGADHGLDPLLDWAESRASRGRSSA